MFASRMVGFVIGTSIFLGYCFYVNKSYREQREHTRERHHQKLPKSFKPLSSKDDQTPAVSCDADDETIDDGKRSTIKYDKKDDEKEIQPQHTTTPLINRKKDSVKDNLSPEEEINVTFLQNLADRLRDDEKKALIDLLKEMTEMTDDQSGKLRAQQVKQLIVEAAKTSENHISIEDLKQLSAISDEGLLRLSEHFECSQMNLLIIPDTRTEGKQGDKSREQSKNSLTLNVADNSSEINKKASVSSSTKSGASVSNKCSEKRKQSLLEKSSFSPLDKSPETSKKPSVSASENGKTSVLDKQTDKEPSIFEWKKDKSSIASSIQREENNKQSAKTSSGFICDKQSSKPSLVKDYMDNLEIVDMDKFQTSIQQMSQLVERELECRPIESRLGFKKN